jgi:DNA polymerase (family 10)
LIDNATIARILTEMADISEIRGDNVFKIRAYRNAADTVESLPYEIASVAKSKAQLLEIKGIGAGIAGRIAEIVETGDNEEHRKMLEVFPPGLLEILQLQGVGPKKVGVFFTQLQVRSLDDLENAARAGLVRSLPRMSEAAEQKLLKAIAEHRQRTGRFLLQFGDQAGGRLLHMLRQLAGVKRAELAGSLRRRRETVGDIDLLVVCERPPAVMDHFCRAGAVLAQGETKSSIRLSSGLQADLRVVPEESFGAAMHYFTGSKGHNVAIRTMGVRKKLTINEYAVCHALEDGSPGERIGGETEEEIFRAVGLPWIPPELREDRGEIEAALAGKLPRLLERSDVRGDVHVHTTRTDGTGTIEEMALGAIERGHSYIAITDHSKALAMTRGLDEAALAVHAQDVARVRDAMRDRIQVFTGIEVDILQDGSLDLADDALASLDVVVGSIHSHFQLDKEEMTARVVRAIESGRIDIVGHPTGRILLRRDAYPLDMERVLEAAARHGVAMEMSSAPDRLDLSDVHARRCKELGVKLVINTDAHSTSNYDLLAYGVGNARRAWIEPENVVNTREPGEFLGMLHDGHR